MGAIERARERGVIRPGDEVVALLTGNGMKTPEAMADPASDALFDGDGIRAGVRIPATYDAFERWFEGREDAPAA